MADPQGNYAIPLFALIDRKKVDLSQPIPEELAESLQAYLRTECGIEALSCKLLQGGDDTMLVLHDVPEHSLPALCSLVDVQRAQLFRYERTAEDAVTLTPLNVRIS